MMSLIFALLQNAADLPPIDFDLAKARRSGADCVTGSGDGIIVCGRRRREQPVKNGQDTPELLLPKAEIGLFGKVRGSLHGDQGSVGGIPSNAAKVTVTIPF